MSKTEAVEKIKEFFSRNEFNSEECRNIKRLAMKFRIRLKEQRKSFCKKCFSQLRGKIRIGNDHKSVECANCGFVNRWKI